MGHAMNNNDTATALPAFVGRTYEVQYGETMTALNIYAADGQTMRY